MPRAVLRTICLGVALGALAGCTAVTRIKEIGDPPALATIADPASPVSAVPTALPIPPPPAAVRNVNSLWASGSRSFFHDPRASRPGDIITVNITVADTAKLSNTTSRSRANSDDANLTNFFGLETPLAAATGADPSNLVNMGSNSSNVGAGSVNRSESINLTLAALVTQVLPNGNLVIGGTSRCASTTSCATCRSPASSAPRTSPAPTRSISARSPRRASPMAAAARSAICSSPAMARSSSTS